MYRAQVLAAKSQYRYRAEGLKTGTLVVVVSWWHSWLGDLFDTWELNLHFGTIRLPLHIRALRSVVESAPPTSTCPSTLSPAANQGLLP